MEGAIQAPQTTPDQRKLAIQINTGLDNVKRLFCDSGMGKLSLIVDIFRLQVFSS